MERGDVDASDAVVLWRTPCGAFIDFYLVRYRWLSDDIISVGHQKQEEGHSF